MTGWIARCAAMMAGFVSGLVATCPASVMAQDLVTVNDVVVLYQPEPARYVPEGGSADLADQGKSFDVTCVITRAGRMSDCQAEENNMADQNFVRIAVRNVSQWVVAPEMRGGDSAEGRILLVTCRFALEGQRDERRLAAR